MVYWIKSRDCLLRRVAHIHTEMQHLTENCMGHLSYPEAALFALAADALEHMLAVEAAQKEEKAG